MKRALKSINAFNEIKRIILCKSTKEDGFKDFRDKSRQIKLKEK